MRCIHDQGGEFIGQGFKHMLQRNGIDDVPTTVKNPQANAICERIHQTIGNVLRTLTFERPPESIIEADEFIDEAIATAISATRIAVSRSLDNQAPGGLAFNRDMLLDVPLLADILAISNKRQRQVDQALVKANAKRRSHDYQPGEQVLVKESDPDKLDDRWHGPYEVSRVHTNGNVTIRLAPNVTERINIRRIKPYRS
jgi:hypothetical protein